MQSSGVRGAPDLVVEVLSAATVVIDRRIKKQLYARYGVPHYWLFDPEQRLAEAHQLADGAYQLITTAQGYKQFAASPFPDLSIPLAELWE